MELLNVVNIYKHKQTKNDIYIGRGSPLGNPYSHLRSSKASIAVVTKEEAIEKYKEFLELNYSDPWFFKELTKIANRYKEGIPTNLVCFCKPAKCHGDVIVDFIKEHFI